MNKRLLGRSGIEASPLTADQMRQISRILGATAESTAPVVALLDGG